MDSSNRDGSRSDDLRDEDLLEDERTRVRWSPRVGTKVTTLLSLSLLAVAAYYLFAPVFMDTSNGWFACGTVVGGPDDDFAKDTCRTATDAFRAKAVLAAALAIIIGIGGLIAFGADRHVHTRPMPSRDEDESVGEDEGKVGDRAATPRTEASRDRAARETARRDRRDSERRGTERHGAERPRRGSSQPARGGRSRRDSRGDSSQRRPRTRDEDIWDDGWR